MGRMNFDTFKEENNEQGSVYRYSKSDLSHKSDFVDRDKEIEHLQKKSSRMLDEILQNLQNL